MKLMRKSLSKINFLCVLILLSLFASAFIFSKKDSSNENLVFCPLQKTWVKKDTEDSTIRKNLLDSICLTKAKKQTLTLEILIKKAFAIDENGVFETLQKGFQVLDDYRNFPNLPQQTLVKLTNSFSLLAPKDDTNIAFFIKKEAFSFALNSRPPTSSNSTKFDFQIAQTLDQISRNINPRSPPFLI
jgi:hypothetical protein